MIFSYYILTTKNPIGIKSLHNATHKKSWFAVTKSNIKEQKKSCQNCWNNFLRGLFIMLAVNLQTNMFFKDGFPYWIWFNFTIFDCYMFNFLYNSSTRNFISVKLERAAWFMFHCQIQPRNPTQYFIKFTLQTTFSSIYRYVW